MRARSGASAGLALVTLVGLGAHPVAAAPLGPREVTIRGQRVVVQGDEWTRTYATPDGQPLDPQELLTTEDWAGTDAVPPKELSEYSWDTQAKAPADDGLPVLLVCFDGGAPQHDQGEFERLFFRRGSRSVADYFAEVSYGRLDVTGEVVDWSTVSRKREHYGRRGKVGMARVQELVAEAVRAVDASVDFGALDRDSSGELRAVCVVHNGVSGDGLTDSLWPHQGTLSYDVGAGDKTGAMVVDGVKIDRYLLISELLGDRGLTTIGAACHEYGHALGLPDLYPLPSRSGSSAADLGAWSLMAHGCGNHTQRPGDCPAHPDPWCKWVLGWLTPTGVRDPYGYHQVGAHMPPAEVFPSAFGLVLTRSVSGGWADYFLVERREQIGFDAALPGSGLCVYHVQDEYERDGRYKRLQGMSVVSLTTPTP